jgi:hypothetical protein
MKKVFLVLALGVFTVNAQESRDEMLGRADMITFNAGVCYVADYGLSLTDAFKYKREARIATTLGIGLGLGLLKETADVYCFQDRFNGTDILFSMGGTLIGIGISEGTQALVRHFENRRKHKKLKL